MAQSPLTGLLHSLFPPFGPYPTSLAKTSPPCFFSLYQPFLGLPMGIHDLWRHLQDAFDTRVSFQVFVSRFAQAHHRTPRLALDANFLLHRSTGGEGDAAKIRTFVAKLVYLMSLNVSFVVVFDGRYKPNKLRNGDDFISPYEHSIPPYDHHPSTYSEGLPIVAAVKKILTAYKIDFIQAPAEAEAECAMLQKYGVVDYVVTDDSDVLVFGATAVLKGFKKDFDSDRSPSKDSRLPRAPSRDTSQSRDSRSPSPSGTFTRDYYVTPVHISSIEKKLGLSAHGLVLVASLRGGDYSTGMNNVGNVRAIHIAQCGTSFAASPTKSPSKRKKIAHSMGALPNFTKIFIDCFVDRSKKYPIFSPTGNPLPKSSRQVFLANFLTLLNCKIKERPGDIFGEQKKFVDDFSIDENIVLLYLFPYVNRKIYKFLPCSSSFGERKPIQLDLRVPVNNTITADASKEEIVPRMNSVRGSDDMFIGNLYVTYTDVTTKPASIFFMQFTPAKEEMVLRASSLTVPSPFAQNVKNLLLKLTTHFEVQPELKELIVASRLKTAEDVDLVMLKYPRNLASKLFEVDDADEQSDDSVIERFWVPAVLLLLVNETLVTELRQQEKLLQKEMAPTTTLDFFGKFPASPTKRGIPTLKKSPKKRSSVKKSPMKKMLPGQSLVTSFFNPNSSGKNLVTVSDSLKEMDLLVENKLSDPITEIKLKDPFIEQESRDTFTKPKNSENPFIEPPIEVSDDLIIEIMAPESKTPSKQSLFLDSDDSDVDVVADLINASSYNRMKGFIRKAPCLSNPPTLSQSNSFDISPSSPTKRKRINDRHE